MYGDGEARAYLLGKIGTAGTTSSLSAILEEACDLYAVDNIAYLALSLPRIAQPIPIVISTYDTQWQSQYRNREFQLIDPVISEGRLALGAVDWDDLDRTQLRVRQFFAEADSFGVGRHGFSKPIQNRLGDQALFTFTSNVSDEDWELFRRRREAELSFIGQAFHEKAVEVAGYRAGSAESQIAPQEQRCLQYLVWAHSPKEIAHIMDISTSTVRMHLRNARTKLRSKTLTQAVAAAVHLGLVTR